jgi:hypothetical protein
MVRRDGFMSIPDIASAKSICAIAEIITVLVVRGGFGTR